MTARCHLRLAGIVFMAMAAMLLMAGEAAAGLSGRAAELLQGSALYAGLLQGGSPFTRSLGGRPGSDGQGV